jgi:hypothetical protein
LGNETGSTLPLYNNLIGRAERNFRKFLIKKGVFSKQRDLYAFCSAGEEGKGYFLRPFQ